MKHIANPSRIFWFVTLPQTLLAAAFIAALAHRMDPVVFLSLILCAATNAAFTLYAVLRRKQPAVDKPASIALIVCCCLTLAAYGLLPGGTPLFRGFISLRLTALLLGGITGLYAVLALTKAITPRADTERYIIALAALPFVWFLAFNIATGVRIQTAAIILIVTGAFIAVFLLARIASVRGAEALAAAGARKAGPIVFSIILSIALPLIGLSLNVSMGNLFGNFSSPWFFVVPIVNGVLLLVPPPSDKRLRLLRFILLSAALPYFVYFFVVFVPFIPIGFIGLLYVVGILLFAPTGALTMQIIELIRESRQLPALWGGKRTALSFITALLLLPACLLTGVIGDRRNLKNAATYLETSAAVSGEAVDIPRLERTLNNATAKWEISRSLFADFETVSNTPFLSAAYSALVLNGKAMKDSDIGRLRRLFFDAPDTPEDAPAGLTINGHVLSDVSLTDAATETVYDAAIGASRTWVHLTLQGDDRPNCEYVALFTLPEGAYISDYYLDVGPDRKYGILADERAAMSVYTDIVRVKRDPGVIHYTGDRQLELRVFPFSYGEIRGTGFEVIHSQSFDLSLSGRTIPLRAINAPEEVPFQGGVLVSAALKRTLPKTDARKLAYYFIVDSSANSLVDYQVSLIKDYAAMAGIHDAEVIFASYNLNRASLSSVKNTAVTPQCGFNLALAIKTILTENGDDTVPVILFASSNPAGAILPEHCSLLAKRFPDSPCYYRLRDDLMLIPYAFDGNDVQPPVTEPVFVPLRAYHDSYVRDDGQSEIVPLNDTEDFTLIGNQYADALALDIALRSHPSMDVHTSLTMLRASFRAHVLTQQSAFIVVETPEQEAALWEAQEALMEQDSAMARETLDEPPMHLMLLSTAGLALIGLLLRRRRQRTSGR